MNKTVSKMLREDTLFCIPSYQRGYRWGKREITALLEDLAEFAEPECKQSTYLLQPIVIRTDKPTGVPDGFAEYKIVVDGQQRLTTLSIILTVLSPDCNISKFWDITNTVYLDNPARRDLNKEFRENAKKTIETWSKEHSEKAKLIAEVLTDHTEGKSVIFIEYELPKTMTSTRRFFV